MHKIKIVIAVIFLFLYLFGGQLSATAAQNGTNIIHVATTGIDTVNCGSENYPCRTLQYAEGKSQSGDTILVAGGTYTYSGANLPDLCYSYTVKKSVLCIINKHLTILGGFSTQNWSTADPHMNPTIIDGQNQSRGITLVGTNSTSSLASLNLEGFTIENGLAQGGTSGADHITGGYGGGIFTSNAPFDLRNITFKNNSAQGGNTNSTYGGVGVGGGLAISLIPNGYSGTLQGISFENNIAHGGQGNTRGGYGIGGGFYFWSATAQISDINMTNNHAQAGNSNGSGQDGTGQRADGLGGGGAIHFDSNMTLENLSASGNIAQGGNANQFGGHGFGGALFIEEGEMYLLDAEIRDNVAIGGNGRDGGIGGGGGVISAASNLILNRTRLIANHAAGGDGSVTMGSVGGGGFYATRFLGNSAITIINSVIADNSIELGFGEQNPGGGGGGLWLQGVQAEIFHTTIAGNAIDPKLIFGGAMLVNNFSTPTPSNIDLIHSTITDHIDSSPEPWETQAAIHVFKGSKVNLYEGLFSNNSNDTNAENDPYTSDGPGLINGLSSMIVSAVAHYISPHYPNFNYHLKQSSTARDQAESSQTTIDIDDQNRPENHAADIGADEYMPFSLFVIPGNRTLSLDWSEDSHIMDGGISKYEILVSCEIGANPPNEGLCDIPIPVGLSTDFTLTGLSDYKEYTITIFALGFDNSHIATSKPESASPIQTNNIIYLPQLFKR